MALRLICLAWLNSFSWLSAFVDLRHIYILPGIYKEHVQLSRASILQRNVSDWCFGFETKFMMEPSNVIKAEDNFGERFELYE